MEAQQPKKNRGPELFGTLLASKPGKTRSPLELAIAIGLHVVILVLLIVVSRPFIPRLADKFFERVTIVVPAEEPQITIAPPTKQQLAAREAVRNQRPQSQEPAGNPLVFTPGPISPVIPEPTAGPETVEPTGEGGGNGSTLTERLRPRQVDPRLLGGSTYTTPGDNSPAAAVRARIAQSIGAYNDSVAAEAEARARATDWTIKDKNGGSWGVSPGKIHLGSITLPLPLAFNPPPGRRDEFNARNRDYAEIEAMANREIGRQGFKDRVKAIRARKDKERAEKKAQENAPITN